MPKFPFLILIVSYLLICTNDSMIVQYLVSCASAEMFSFPEIHSPLNMKICIFCAILILRINAWSPQQSLGRKRDLFAIPVQGELEKIYSRRSICQSIFITSCILPVVVNADDLTPKFVQEYSDFTEAPSGWRYRDVSLGSGSQTAQKGDRVVFDWSGYTIGYFGRPFQAKGGPMGGAFDKDLDYSRTVIGSGSMVKAVEEALVTMKPGGVRQVVVPFQKDLSYPPDDLIHERVGPKPATFSGQRALNFVLENPRLDRTLLFNLKLIRVDKSDGKGGFIRGKT
jgi:FKBP-type peptidyl-prolyl cis-trans isomerase